MKKIRFMVVLLMLLSGCTTPPSVETQSVPTPSVSPEVVLPDGDTQIAFIKAYMGPNCAGTDGGLTVGGREPHVQRIDLRYDGTAVVGTVEGFSGDSASQFEYGCGYFKAEIRGVVGLSDGKPYVESLTYKGNNSGPFVWFVRVEEAAADENRRVVARRWYDKPCVVGIDTAAADKVNTFFEEECKAYFSEGEERFWGEADEMLAQTGTGRFVDFPLRDTCSMEVAYLTPELLSIKRTDYWFMGGTAPFYDYGYTFDLRTGELLNVDHFLDMDLASFKAMIIEDYQKESGARESEAWLEKYYQDYDFADFEYIYNGQEIIVYLNELQMAGGSPALHYPYAFR